VERSGDARHGILMGAGGARPARWGDPQWRLKTVFPERVGGNAEQRAASPAAHRELLAAAGGRPLWGQPALVALYRTEDIVGLQKQPGAFPSPRSTGSCHGRSAPSAGSPARRSSATGLGSWERKALAAWLVSGHARQQPGWAPSSEPTGQHLGRGQNQSVPDPPLDETPAHRQLSSASTPPNWSTSPHAPGPWTRSSRVLKCGAPCGQLLFFCRRGG